MQVITEEPSIINHAVWGSQGQPAYPVSINEMVSAEWNEYLDMLTQDFSSIGSRGGLLTKERYYSKGPEEQVRYRNYKF